MTTPDLKTCCQLYRPGVQKTSLSASSDPRVQAVWAEFVEKVGGKEVVESRKAKVASHVNEFN